MNKLAAIILCTVALGGCAVAPVAPVTHKIDTPFNAEQASAMLQEGENTITGNAFMRQSGGGVVTCAGSSVDLVPATSYASERIKVIYGNTSDAFSRTAVKFESESAAYRALRKTTICDSQGNFQFDKIGDGEFFVVTSVTWVVGANNRQGGVLMKSVQLSNKKTAKIVLAH